MPYCKKCRKNFNVPEDESPNEQGCPRCGTDELTDFFTQRNSVEDEMIEMIDRKREE